MRTSLTVHADHELTHRIHSPPKHSSREGFHLHADETCSCTKVLHVNWKFIFTV